MKKYVSAAIVLAIVTAPAALLAAKAPAKAPVKKPVAKPTTTNRATAGTKQLSGENDAKFGTTYTIGKSDPSNITINSAEYSCEQLKIGDRCWLPKANEKLLVIHYTVHNPQKSEALMRFDSLNFTVVDAKNTNWESIEEIGGDKTLERVEIMMKPAQKMDLCTAVVVPAQGQMAKLIVKSNDQLVLRYQLPGKVKALPAAYADPSDTTGGTALATVPAKIGVYYPMGGFLVKLDKVEGSNAAKIGERELSEGSRWLVFTFTAKNQKANQELIRFDTFQPKLLDQDGSDVEWNGEMFSATRDKTIETEMDLGKEISFRFVFDTAGDIKPQSLSMKETEEARQFIWDSATLNLQSALSVPVKPKAASEDEE